jgi:hypothetical protein
MRAIIHSDRNERKTYARIGVDERSKLQVKEDSRTDG